jgi:hypothetical protein
MEYIRTARSLGAKDDHIHAQLTAAGWYTVDVQDALHLYQKLDIHLASVQERVLATKASGRKPEIEPPLPRSSGHSLIATFTSSFNKVRLECSFPISSENV